MNKKEWAVPGIEALAISGTAYGFIRDMEEDGGTPWTNSQGQTFNQRGPQECHCDS